MEQRRQSRTSRQTTGERQAAPRADGGSTLLQEVEGWGRAAAEALARTQSVADAEQELERRHNTSGE